MNESPLKRAIAILGGPTKVGKLFTPAISKQAVIQWGDECPLDRCKTIELATGGQVTRHDLRPDHFDALPKRRRAA